jgi:glycosyltransferase involved in cell wall biosynthesis
MKILFVSQEMPPETGWGGIGTYVDVLSEALAAKGADVHVLSAVAGQSASCVKQDGVTVHRCGIPAARGPGMHAPESWQRAELAVSVTRLISWLGLKPDVVECPEWMAEGLAVGFRSRYPLVVRLHSTARQVFPLSGQGPALHGLDARGAAWLEETSARRANVVISTRANLDEVKGFMGLDERAVHAIPYPVRLPEATSVSTNGPPQVTFVGRLELRKGPDVLLRAVPRVLAAVPEARFTFVGRDVLGPGAKPSSQWLREEAARLGVADALEFTGGLDRRGVDEQLRQATVCAFPSRWESFGNVVAEASAIGRPVVVSDIAPFHELVHDGVTGRMLGLDDTDGWAEALVALLRDRKRARALGDAGAAHIAGLSGPAHVADLTLSAHRHAVERWASSKRAGRWR